MFVHQKFPFLPPAEISTESSIVQQAVVVGAGPVGLTLAIAMAKLGVQVVLLTEGDQVCDGSRAICFSRRSLEIFDKLGVAKPMMEKGVQWNVGRIFYKGDEIDRFDLSPNNQSKFPAFINLQQYYVEQLLVEAAQLEKNLEIRWLNKVTDLQKITEENNGNVQLTVATPTGEYDIKARFLIACDGSRSDIRHLMGLEMHGERFEERFLIVDFKMEADFPSERWFWFDPPFAPGQSILLHKQPDNLWRLDFKLGKAVDSAIVNDIPFINQKIKSVVGDCGFVVVWTSIYSFSNKMLDKFVHGNVVFAGDAAHVLSPFGARGGNSGIEDADNLAWKLAAIIKDNASSKLLQTYDAERSAAARQNIQITNQSATFIAPSTADGLRIRNQVLENAAHNATAKKQINCGRLSAPSVYGSYTGSENGSWKSTTPRPGQALKDCFFNDGKDYLTEHLGYNFTVICQNKNLDKEGMALLVDSGCKILGIDPQNSGPLITLYELVSASVYLVTPDQYILGRWKIFTARNAVNLITRYLSGEVFLEGNIEKTEQELLDEKVYSAIMNGNIVY